MKAMINMLELGLYGKIALSAALGFFGLIFSILVIRWLVRVMRVEADQVETLKLANRGNCACQYQIAVNSPAPHLKFTLYADGVPLAPVFEEIEEEVVEQKASANKADQPKAAKATPAANSSTQEATKTAKVDQEGALKKGQEASAKAGIMANILGIAGSILPGKMGESVKGAAGGARKVQKTSAQAVQAPKSAQRKMDAMKRSGNRLGVKGNATPDNGSGSPQPKHRGRQMHGKREQTEFSRPTRDVVKKVKKTVEKVGVVQTIDVDPGKVLYLALEISKKGRRYPTGSFGYSIESQPIPLNKRLGEAPAAVKKGQVHFERIGFWRYWMPSVSVLVYLFLLALVIYYTYLYLWA